MGGGGLPQSPFGTFVDYFTVFNSSPNATSKTELLVTKYRQWLETVVTVVTESFILNPTLKSLDKFRLRQ